MKILNTKPKNVVSASDIKKESDAAEESYFTTWASEGPIVTSKTSRREKTLTEESPKVKEEISYKGYESDFGIGAFDPTASNNVKLHYKDSIFGELVETPKEESIKFVYRLGDLTPGQKEELAKRVKHINNYSELKLEEKRFMMEINEKANKRKIQESKTTRDPYESFTKGSNLHAEFEKAILGTYKSSSLSFSSSSRRPIPEFYKKIENVTIGSDFELFLFDNNLKEVINAKPYVKGSKHFPYNFDKSSEFWCTSLDNILAEMNIPPVKNEKDFNAYVQKAIDYLESTLPKNITTLAQPAMYIKEEYLNTEESRQFGCTPSYDAYTLNENQQPDGEQTNLRTGAFHIHIKYDKMNFELSAELIKMLDLYLGIPSIVVEPANDRRKLYGTPGEFRYSEDKTTEYRVLSNFFSKNESLRTWVFKNTMAAIEHMNTKGPLSSETTNHIRKTIKNSILSNAEKLIDNYNIILP